MRVTALLSGPNCKNEYIRPLEASGDDDLAGLKTKLGPKDVQINAPGYNVDKLFLNLETRVEDYRHNQKYQDALRSVKIAERPREHYTTNVYELSTTILQLQRTVVDPISATPKIDSFYKWPLKPLALRFRKMVQDEITWRLPYAFKRQVRFNEYVLKALQQLVSTVRETRVSIYEELNREENNDKGRSNRS